ERGDEEQERADGGPVASAEARHREGIGETEERAGEAGQRDEREQLIGGVAEAGGGQARGDHDPHQPHREAEVLGEDRPDEIAARDAPARALPEERILRVPRVDPASGPSHATERRSRLFRSYMRVVNIAYNPFR